MLSRFDLQVSRRTVLQTASAGLVSVGLPSSSSASSKPAKSVLIVFLTGACSHHDTFDPKPEAPAEVRGQFSTIATSVPGMLVCEHLPRLAACADKYALVRTLSHGDNNHLMSTHHVLTGAVQPGAFFDKVASRDDWPNYAGALAYLRPRSDGIPSGVNLPTFLMGAPLTWPGQHAGLLGPRFDPWQIVGDPNHPDFKVDSVRLSDGVTTQRLDQRRRLLSELDRSRTSLDTEGVRRATHDQELAFSVLTSSRFAEAFRLDREANEVRDRYGRNPTGQSLLLGRRLVEAGVPVVQVNVGGVQSWDHHAAIFTTLKDRWLPIVDQGVAALLDDLSASGMLENTLVAMFGEFGRTPKINDQAGRDHWGPCFFGLFAGAGVRGGQVIGRSDAIGAYPVTAAYSPDDLGATIYHVLGVSPEAEIRDRLNRPLQLNRGRIIAPLFGDS